MATRSSWNSPETFEWYRYRLERFVQRHPDLEVAHLWPFHVETWADSYALSVTSRRNYLRSVKRCVKWAKKQGYIDNNPIADMKRYRVRLISSLSFSGSLPASGDQRTRLSQNGELLTHFSP